MNQIKKIVLPFIVNRDVALFFIDFGNSELAYEIVIKQVKNALKQLNMTTEK